jgi:hypothetical protein
MAVLQHPTVAGGVRVLPGFLTDFIDNEGLATRGEETMVDQVRGTGEHRKNQHGRHRERDSHTSAHGGELQVTYFG